VEIYLFMIHAGVSPTAFSGVVKQSGGSLQVVKDCFRAFLQSRGMDKANGQMLFRYRATLEEYRAIRELLAARLVALGGAPWRFESRAESALFVLYASEWWRREYEGGAWRWTSIFRSLTTGPYRADPMERSVIVELGLRAWGHRPSEDGKKYLGAIVAQGGLPLKMVARGDGATSRLLLGAARKAQLLGWEEQQIAGYFESHADDMVQHLRAPEIYRLLAEMVMTSLSLRRDHGLAGSSNPVQALEQAEPRWRERFPIAMDDQAVEPLLVGLVREVSRQSKSGAAYPVSVTRSLVRLAGAEDFALSMSIQLPTTMSVEALASAMEVTPSQVPQTFTLEIAGRQRIPVGQGRQLLGGQSSTVLLVGKPLRFLGAEACHEVLVALRGVGADMVSPTSVPGGEALDESQPWCFATLAGTLTLIGMGSCRVAGEVAYVLAPGHFKLVPREGSSVVVAGQVGDLPEPRCAYKVQGTVDILVDEDAYCIRTGAQDEDGEQLVWKGNRHWFHSSPFPVFRGVPRLYRVDAEGRRHAVPDKDIEWVQAVRRGAPLANVRGHRGPVDAWLSVEGRRQRRFRMALVAPDARIAFTSGADECDGSIEFHGWGVSALHADAGLSRGHSTQGLVTGLSLQATGQPPASMGVIAEWSTAWPVLHVDLPFPSSGGRFSHSEGRVLPQGAMLPTRHVQDIRVQVFDRNPTAPRAYRLEIQLQGESLRNRARRAQVKVPLDANGVGDVRFLEIESTLNSLFCQSDHLDACLEVTLFAGPAAIRSLKLARYDLELERDLQSLAIPTTRLANLSAVQRQGIALLAIPLLDRSHAPRELAEARTDDVPAGSWDMTHLPAGLSPWLVYPSAGSSLQARPTLWSTTAFDKLGTLQGLGDGLCPLAGAMAISSPEERTRMLGMVIEAMAADLDHPSWRLLAHHYQQLRHLPLSTLDYWRVVGRNQDACLAVVLKFPGDLHDLMQRMREELGVLWELTSRRSLQHAHVALSTSLAGQLGPAVAADLSRQLVDDLFAKIGSAAESLAMQVEQVLFQASGVQGIRFERLVADASRAPSAILRQLWHGEDSLLQRVLLRSHADDGIWPYFKLWEDLLEAIQRHGDAPSVAFLHHVGTQLLWLPKQSTGGSDNNPRLDVANSPLLVGYLVQACDANTWLQSGGTMAALRQVRAFDPTWFDLGIQAGSLLAMKAHAHRASATPPATATRTRGRAPTQRRDRFA